MRLSRLADWYLIAAIMRFVALWLLATFFGYGTPLFVAFCLVPIALLWAWCKPRLWQQLVIELLVLAGLILYSQHLIVPLYTGVILLLDQLLTRALFTDKGDAAGRRLGLHRLILLAFSGLSLLAIAYVGRDDAMRYLNNHDPLELAQFQPQGVPQLWLAKRTLDEGVYWESRFPRTTEQCAIVFHGADSRGSLQSTARSICLLYTSPSPRDRG